MDEVVFDPFCGCATTLVAADRLERKWVGIDISPKAVDLIEERIRRDYKEEGAQRSLLSQIVARKDILNVPI